MQYTKCLVGGGRELRTHTCTLQSMEDKHLLIFHMMLQMCVIGILHITIMGLEYGHAAPGGHLPCTLIACNGKAWRWCSLIFHNSPADNCDWQDPNEGFSGVPGCFTWLLAWFLALLRLLTFPPFPSHVLFCLVLFLKINSKPPSRRRSLLLWPYLILSLSLLRSSFMVFILTFSFHAGLGKVWPVVDCLQIP